MPVADHGARGGDRRFLFGWLFAETRDRELRRRTPVTAATGRRDARGAGQRASGSKKLSAAETARGVPFPIHAVSHTIHVVPYGPIPVKEACRWSRNIPRKRSRKNSSISRAGPPMAMR